MRLFLKIPKYSLLAVVVASSAEMSLGAPVYSGGNYGGITLVAVPSTQAEAAPPSGDAKTAHDQFLSDLGGFNASNTGLGLQNFDGFASPLAVNLTSVAVSFQNFNGSTLASAGLTDPIAGSIDPGFQARIVTDYANSFGRFDTTIPGDTAGNFVESGGADGYPLGRLVFDFAANPLSAFGFYLTDLFDQGADTFVQINAEAPISLAAYLSRTIESPPPDNSDANARVQNGDLVFFGSIRNTANINTVSIYSQQLAQYSTPTDLFGLDEFYVLGAPTNPPVVPEPSTLALAGLAMVSGALRYRRRQAA